MGNWSKDGFAKHPPVGENALMQAVSGLQLSTRQKIYAFIQRGGVFRRRTWNGCVMNAITKHSDVMAVARTLGESPHRISTFIRAWDGTSRGIPSDALATVYLSRLLENIGIVKETPKVEVDPSKIVRKRIYTSAETEAIEEFRKEIEDGIFDELLSGVKELELIGA